MFLVHTHPLWIPSKAVLIIIVVDFTARIQDDDASCCDLPCLPSKVFFVPIVVLAFFNSAVTVMPSSRVPQNHIIVWAYISLVIGETEILLSTVYQSMRRYRQVGGKSRLLSIPVHHISLYFCCLASSVRVIVTTAFFPDTLPAIMHGILVDRVHRSLWKSYREKKDPSHPTVVSLPTMYFGSLPPPV
ncbi:hypothetical protein BDN67DRAFT_650453 [Paxillus ammoniavirescens]|nr:hypothetical protein BDN67DRAFT_650453 [Paxillus ammoniavirescens]